MLKVQHLLVAFLLIWSNGNIIAQEICLSTLNDIAHRFDCLPHLNISKVGLVEGKEKCLKRRCCWEEIESKWQNISGPYRQEYLETRYPIHIGAPLCFLPINRPPNYEFDPPTTDQATEFLEQNKAASVTLKQKNSSTFSNDIPEVQIDVYPQNNNLLRIKISDARKARYEVPFPILQPSNHPLTTPNYQFKFGNKSGFMVSRRDTGETILNATVGEFIFADQFLQLSALLSSNLMYGLSQSHDTFARSFDWQLCPLFASLLYPDYGSHPFYVAMEKSGRSHGVFLFNSNAMDVLLQPTPAITYRAVGGILDFYIFLGPTPEEVIQQYTQLVGLPALVPYWSLGFHLSRYNYGSLNGTRDVWLRNRDAGIPYDVQWNDIDYMSTGYKIFTYNNDTYNGLPEFIDTLHNNSMRYVCITDAGITATPGYETFDRGLTMNVFIKDHAGGLAIGTVWPKESVFTDFTHSNASDFWDIEFDQFHTLLPFDGSWIDMNEMTTFSFGSVDGTCPTTKWDDPPYVPCVFGNNLAAAAICMSGQQQIGVHYDLHNIYGFTMSIHTHRALEKSLGKRAFVLSRSTAPGQGKYSAHWTGDVYSSWEDLQQVIPGILNFNLFGVPMVGSDICGFRINTTFELCQRWTQLGAFSPFARNHNDRDTIDQDPAAFGEKMIAIFNSSFIPRYNILPFMYTQFYRTQTQGGTVIRPLFFEFPNDSNTYLIQDQFLWGRALMVLPVLTQNATSIEPYFPKGQWYFWPNLTQPLSSDGSRFKIDMTDPTKVVVAIRGGSIIPTQASNQTTNESRKNKFGLMVGLDEQQTASGELFWDDGTTVDTVETNQYSYITFNVSQNTLWSTVVKYYDVPYTNFILGNVKLMGLYQKPSSLTIQNVSSTNFEYDSTAKCLHLTNLSVPLSQPIFIRWIF